MSLTVAFSKSIGLSVADQHHASPQVLGNCASEGTAREPEEGDEVEVQLPVERRTRVLVIWGESLENDVPDKCVAPTHSASRYSALLANGRRREQCQPQRVAARVTARSPRPPRSAISAYQTCAVCEGKLEIARMYCARS